MLKRLGTAILAVTGVALLSGCGGDEPAKVSGSVTYNGDAIESGVVTFQADDGKGTFSAPISGGQYVANDAHAGQFKVVIQSSAPAAAATSREAFQQQATSAGSAKEPENYIPADAAGNGQTVEITAGEQTHDFAITGPPRKK